MTTIFARSLSEVVEQGLCSGCGLCESMAGREAVEMRLNSQGFLRPLIKSSINRHQERSILKACPGATVSGTTQDESDPIWGPLKATYTGHAIDSDLRHRCSSGGTTTAMAIYMLEHDIIDVVLHVGPSPDAPMKSVALASYSRADIEAGIGARYCPAAPLTLLHELAYRHLRILLVAKPCDVAAARSAARQDSRVAKALVAAISVFCGGVSSQGVSLDIAARQGMTEQDIRLFRYRGYGCPGSLHIEATDGRIHEQGYDETWSSDMKHELQFRCKICPDTTGESADIACGDAWITADGYSNGEYEGSNAVIARTAKGQALLNAARDAGYLALTEVKLETIARMQPHHIALKRSVGARLLGLMFAGEPIMRTTRLRLYRCATELPLRDLWVSGYGTWRRARGKKNRESLPGM